MSKGDKNTKKASVVPFEDEEGKPVEMERIPGSIMPRRVETQDDSLNSHAKFPEETAETKELPVETKELPAETKELPVETKELPVETKELPTENAAVSPETPELPQKEAEVAHTYAIADLLSPSTIDPEGHFTAKVLAEDLLNENVEDGDVLVVDGVTYLKMPDPDLVSGMRTVLKYATEDPEAVAKKIDGLWGQKLRSWGPERSALGALGAGGVLGAGALGQIGSLSSITAPLKTDLLQKISDSLDGLEKAFSGLSNELALYNRLQLEERLQIVPPEERKYYIDRLMSLYQTDDINKK